MSGAQASLLPDGRRLHLHHGPIDIIAEAFGNPRAVRHAYARTVEAFRPLLEILVGELDELRRPAPARPDLGGPVARRMAAAVAPHSGRFVTPMAAVAGAVADHLLAALAAADVERAYINTGGDIAFWLQPGTALDAGIIDDAERPHIDSRVRLPYDQPVRGLATSGWRGRSHSLGIADAVTVLARSAAAADAAATLIANAVNCDDPGIERQPAGTLQEDSDLGHRLVTVAVDPLPDAAIESALAHGQVQAQAMLRAGLIECAYLGLQGQRRTVQPEARRRVA